MSEMIELEAIRSVYAGRKARRSGLHYMRHIDQGLYLLRHFEATDTVQRAWCVHPIFQLEEYFVLLMSRSGMTPPFGIDWKVAAMATEYRAAANSYLTEDERPHAENHRQPRLSSIPEVNFMLQIDKVQNYRDARLHLFQHINVKERDLLDRYFHRWFDALHLERSTVYHMEHLLQVHDGDTQPP